MPRWKMLVGKFYRGGTVIKKGDIFEATLEQVKGIRNQLEALDAIEEYMAETDQDVPRRKLEAVHLGHGKWNVINSETGKVINDLPLDKRQAQQLVDKLLTEPVEAPPARVPEVPEVKTIPESKNVVEEKTEEEPPVDTKSKKPSVKKGTGDTSPVEGKRGLRPRRRTELT